MASLSGSARFLPVLATLASCADIGPFRASGGVDGGVDDAVAITDAPTGDALPPDGSVEVVPKQLATVPAGASRLAVTTGDVYWATSAVPYQIQRVAKAGGAVQKIDAGEAVSLLVAHDSAIAWAGSRAIRVATDATFVASSPVLTTTTTLASIALSPTQLYLVRDKVGGGSNLLERLPRAGGAVEPLSATFESFFIAASDASLYWASFPGLQPQLDRSTFAAPTTIAASVPAADLQRFFNDGDRFCWTAKPGGGQAIDLWCSTAGAPRKVATGLYDIVDVAMSAKAVWFIERAYPASFAIKRYDLATHATSTTVGPSTTRLPTELAVDATTLYWVDTAAATSADAIIWSLPLE